MLPYVYQVTKYDPADRDQHGHHAGTEDTTSDHGPVETASLQAVAAFAEDSGVDQLAIREPQLGGFAHFGLEPPVDGYGLAGLFPAGPAGFHDGALVPIGVGLELVRAMLRDNGAWHRLGRPGGGTFGEERCPIAADHLDPWPLREPSGQVGGFPVGQQVHRTPAFDVDQDGPVVAAFAGRVLIDPNHARGRKFRVGQGFDQPQHRAAAGGQAEDSRHAGSGPTGEREAACGQR